MKKAVIMTRVSTDEQADRGYSLRVQEETLKRYCSINEIEIVRIIREDHSAKSFERPEFKKFLAFAKSNYKQIDYFLFTSWDRFSRNTADAYDMIKRFTKWGIEPQAVEQPIDFSIPENKAMLAFYLAIPEIDNDRRRIKVVGGMRRAMKEGRWTNRAPIGYLNKRDELNKPVIILAPNSKHITWAFNEASKGQRPLNEIRQELNAKGVKIAKTSFYRMMQNPVYLGKIRVPAYDNEPEIIVDGLHEALTDEITFDRVQDVINGRFRRLKKVKKMSLQEELPLRGFLQCSCGNHMTGSGSRSKTGKRHFYYHCQGKDCKTRYRADLINNDFQELLSCISISEGVQNLYEKILNKLFGGNVSDIPNKRIQIKEQIDRLNEQKNRLQDMLLDGNLDAIEYSELREKVELKLRSSIEELKNLKSQNSTFNKFLKRTLTVLPNISKWYANSGIQEKRNIISSIFPEKIVFDGKECRTQSINPAISLILLINNKVEGKKKGQTTNLSRLSRSVIPLGLEPRTLSLKGICSTN